MQIKQILQLALNQGLDHLDAELLIALSLKKDRIFVLSRPDYQLSQNQSNKILAHIKKRATGFPFAYLSGQKEFYGLDFKVTPSVLIPRPETEIIVDYILNRFPKEKISLIDVGCGSGSIIIAIAKNRQKRDKYLGLDISLKALTIAKYNAHYHGLKNKIRFSQSDLLNRPLNSPALIQYLAPNKKQRLVITANLPYLKPQQITANPDLKYEPRLALTAGADGLKYYKKLLPQVKSLINLGFPEITLILEIDPSQSLSLQQYLKKICSKIKYQVITKNDLAGLSRCLIIDLKNN